MFGDEYFNGFIAITENEEHFVKVAVIFQRFAGRHEVWIGVTYVVEEIGQNTKTNFIFYVFNRVTDFDDDHRAEHFIAQLRVT